MRVGAFRRFAAGLGLGLVAATAASAAVVPGDVSGNGRVDVTDVVAVVRYAAGMQTLTDDQKLAADVSPLQGGGGRPIGDGTVNIQDALVILRAVADLAQLPSEFPGQNPGTGILLPARVLVDVNGTAAAEVVLPDGVLLQGRVTNAQGQPAEVEVDVTETTTGHTGFTSGEAGAFRLGVAPGSYSVELGWFESDPTNPFGGGVSWSYRVPEPVVVPASGATKDFVLPTPPALFAVSGVITLSNTGFLPSSVTFEQVGEAPLLATSNTLALGGSYATRLPAGTYKVLVQAFAGLPDLPGGLPDGFPTGVGDPGVPPAPSAQQLGIEMIFLELPDRLVVSGNMTHNLTVPKALKVSGTVTSAAGAPVPASTFISIVPSEGDAAAGSSAFVQQGRYTVWVLPGTYDFQSLVSQESNGLVFSQFPTLLENQQITQDQTVDITLPTVATVAASSQLSGTVRDSRGTAIGAATVTIGGEVLGASPPTTASVKQVVLGPDGRFAAQVPAGKYTVSAVPTRTDGLDLVSPPYLLSQ